MTNHDVKKSEWFNHKSTDNFGAVAESRDLGEFRRNGYSHWGVYVGLKENKHSVIHVSGPSLNGLMSAVGLGESRIALEKVRSVADKGPFRINNMIDKDHPPKSPEEIVAVAEANVGGKVDYNVWNDNCCHTATEYRSGIPSSSEVEQHSRFTLG